MPFQLRFSILSNAEAIKSGFEIELSRDRQVPPRSLVSFAQEDRAYFNDYGYIN